jgi:sugar porter (SP) family MFS transporter
LIMLLGIGLQAGSANFSMFVGGRFILGFGDIIINVTAPLLICEIAPAQDRAILVTIQGATYHSGAFIAAWVTYGTLKIPNNWSWRAPSLLQGVFTIFMLCVVYWIPESPRYHIAKDRPEKAMQTLAKYHADGNEHDEVVQLEFAEIQTALRLEKQAKKSSSFLDFLRTKGNRRRLYILISVGLFSQWSGNGLVSYYLNLILDSIGITDSNQQLLINGAITSFNLVTNFGFSFFVDKWGRRPIYLISTIGTLVTYVIWTILSERYAATSNKSYGSGVLAMIFFYSLAYNLKSGLIASYTTEILPFNLRAKGFAVMEYALYGALFFNQYVNPIALDSIHWKYYIVYCVFLAFEVVVIYFLYVETRYVPLEEVTKLFDGEDVAAITTTELKTIPASGEYVEQVTEVAAKV